MLPKIPSITPNAVTTVPTSILLVTRSSLDRKTWASSSVTRGPMDAMGNDHKVGPLQRVIKGNYRQSSRQSRQCHVHQETRLPPRVTWSTCIRRLGSRQYRPPQREPRESRTGGGGDADWLSWLDDRIGLLEVVSVERCGNLWQLWLSLMMLVSLTACTGSTPPIPLEPTPTAIPTPTPTPTPTTAPTQTPVPTLDIKATVWARIKATTESILTATAVPTPAEEVTAVRASFEGYKQAILGQAGEKSVGFVDRNTLAYYQKMRDLALRGDQETIRALSTVDKLFVLSIRHRISPEEVELMTGESLFVYAVNQGWIGKASVINNEVGDITVSGTHATGVHLSRGKATPLKFVFQRENGKWKLDLTSIMPAADQAFKQVIRESGLDEDEILITILESVSGKKVADTVWDPMIK